MKAKTAMEKQIPRFCQQKEEYCSSFPTQADLTCNPHIPGKETLYKINKQTKYDVLPHFSPAVKMPISQTQRSKRSKVSCFVSHYLPPELTNAEFPSCFEADKKTANIREIVGSYPDSRVSLSKT